MQTPVKEHVDCECGSSVPQSCSSGGHGPGGQEGHGKVIGGDMRVSSQVQALWVALAAAQECLVEIPRGPSPMQRSSYGLVRDIVEYS
jgi:hypothetical protein